MCINAARFRLLEAFYERAAKMGRDVKFTDGCCGGAGTDLSIPAGRSLHIK
ncbi:MAG: hypothetical protein A4E54_01241 [Pelotomaculum sp. PtaB.Bin117]|nr:MAG: hypothetical protein A4E54_01241 [Pelotomaculum sp. PtaB.Bin117]OPY63582.1 MAG: hypothetical protein A4E56_00461 [Pelotomaculum sp. PtaU1.Bin065]